MQIPEPPHCPLMCPGSLDLWLSSVGATLAPASSPAHQMPSHPTMAHVLRPQPHRIPPNPPCPSRSRQAETLYPSDPLGQELPGGHSPKAPWRGHQGSCSPFSNVKMDCRSYPSQDMSTAHRGRESPAICARGEIKAEMITTKTRKRKARRLVKVLDKP